MALDLDVRSERWREQMVEWLSEQGITNERVLTAMRRVPRHRFVERFLAVQAGSPQERATVTDLTAGDTEDSELAQVYDPQTALITKGQTGRLAATSSVSAPIIVATMLEELDLTEGLRVLEIGAGSGYNAALIAELVGDPSLVTTIDLDAGIVTATASRLEQLGYAQIELRCADGVDGVPDRAPFDRIVATVGCLDVTAAWRSQLAETGTLLVPLEHGGFHPRVKFEKSGERLSGRFVGHSGFVRIGGSQSRSMSAREAPTLEQPLRTRQLPEDLWNAVAPAKPDRPVDAPGLWNFGLYLAARDGRCCAGPGLTDGRSYAVVRGAEIAVHGPAGEEFYNRICAVGFDWLALGCPGLTDYELTMTPRTGAARSGNETGGPWLISRIDHDEQLRMTYS